MAGAYSKISYKPPAVKNPILPPPFQIVNFTGNSGPNTR
jgi:hypothetical protein